ncbi:MAG: hypothetical protein HY253_11765 [Burkholderiales bacterium]|nr:hypothetical protein [Burkholderiales bacterium]
MLIRKSMRTFLFMACVLSALLMSSLHAMQVERSFPEGIKRGKLSTTALADLVIDGKLLHSSVALRIFDEENRIVMPASLYVKNAPVNYLLNEMGEVHRVWMLTEEEARRPLPKS